VKPVIVTTKLSVWFMKKVDDFYGEPSFLEGKFIKMT
jgi:hypothetical protein